MGQAIAITSQDHSVPTPRKLAGESDDAEVAQRLLTIAMALDGCCAIRGAIAAKPIDHLPGRFSQQSRAYLRRQPL